MSKNVEHIQHIKSNVVLEGGKPKLPTSDVLVEGELAINYAEGYETLSIKNSEGNVVRFSSDNYYTEQKLGSGFTGSNSAETVTSVIEENEKVISAALNRLNLIKADSSAITEVSGAVSTHTANTNIHVTAADKTSWNAKLDATAYTPVTIDQVINSSTSASTGAVSTSAVYGFVTSYTPSITVDQVLDDTTSASTNPVSSKAVYDAVTDNELVWTNAYVTLSGAVSSHTQDSTIHVTASDKQGFHTHSNKSNLDSITGNVGTMAYENASNYYTTANTSGKTEISDALSAKVNTQTYIGHTGDSTVHFTGTEKSNIMTISGNTDVLSGISSTKVDEWNAVSAKTDTSTFNSHTGDSTVHFTGTEKSNIMTISGNTNVLSGITSTNVNNWNTVSAKTDNTAFTASTTVSANYISQTSHVEFYNSAGTKLYDFDASPFIIDGMVQNVEIKDVTSGASQVTCLVISFNTYAGKQDINIPISDIFDANNYYTKTQIDNLVGSGFTSSSITDVIIENEEIVSAAWNDLNGRKLDASAYTPTDLSNYYTKDETSGKTEISNALGGKVNSATFTAHTADSTSHLTSTEKSQLHTHSNKTYLDGITGSVGTMAYENASSYSSATQVSTALGNKANSADVYTKSQTSGATELSTALSGKSNTGHTHSSNEVTSMSGYSIAASGTAITTADTLNQAIGKLEKQNVEIVDYIEEKELAIAAALTDLDEKIGDIETILATI